MKILYQGMEEKIHEVIFNIFVPTASATVGDYFTRFIGNATHSTTFGVISLTVTSVLLLLTIQNSFDYTNWCCGASFSNENYDEDHPIMEGMDDVIDIYRFHTSYLPSDNDAEVVFNAEWWGYEYSHIIFSKIHGSGRVTVLGFNFDGWYDDEALMLANAVQYTSRAWVQPGSGTISPLGSESISVTIPTDELPFGSSVIDLVIDYLVRLLL